ncbi:hypothetical protein Patl1_12187 [Pistacia atlantica]|uniref:Uncharacterized protein n=1 Tax=Pistacia atlantica TaxID=434234 RepID=A0ACC1A6R6_9ROSI|nr:hypothetical protein Patl1_12187 [Pistacia atlantica]
MAAPPSQPIPMANSSSESFQSDMEQSVIIELANPSRSVASSTQHMALSSSQLGMEFLIVLSFGGIFVMVHHIACKFIPSYMTSYIRSCKRKMMPCIWSGNRKMMSCITSCIQNMIRFIEYIWSRYNRNIWSKYIHYIISGN